MKNRLIGKKKVNKEPRKKKEVVNEGLEKTLGRFKSLKNLVNEVNVSNVSKTKTKGKNKKKKMAKMPMMADTPKKVEK